MNLRYELSLRLEAFEVLSRVAGTRKKAILAYLNALRDNPFLASDYTDKEPDGSYLENRIIGRYAIYYYVDHAAKEVWIMKIVEADR